MTESPTLAVRLTTLVESLAQRVSDFPPDRWRARLLVLAAAIFIAGGSIAANRVDLAWSELRWEWLIPATIVGIPATIGVNALEFRLSGRAIGTKVTFGEALGVSITATAANQLPVPGGAIVRVQALRKAGNRYRHAVGTTVAIALAWLAVALLLAGGVVAGSGYPQRGLLLGLAGGGPAAAMLLIAWKAFPPGGRPRLIALVLLVEVASVLVNALRLHMVLLGMNQDVGFATPLLITLAGVIAAVMGVFPSGLGLREALAGALVPIAGVSSAVGFLSAALSRILSLAVLAPISIGLAIRARRQGPPVPVEADSALPR